MWAQEQIIDSGNILRVWSKCILYFFKNPDKLPDHSYTHETSLHLIWHHFIDPVDHHNYSNFLVSRDVCEASTILALPNGMILCENLHMTKWLSLDQFELKLTLHVSAPSWSSFLDQICSCEASMIYIGPFLPKFPRTVVLPSLNTPDITLDT